MARLELVTECGNCLGTGRVTHPADAELVHCGTCNGEGGSRIPLDPGRSLFIDDIELDEKAGLFTVQDVLDALEAT